MTIELNPITSGYSTGLINDNFQAIEDYVNNKLLQRDGVEVGEVNQMEVDLDMNSNFIYNLPEPTLEHQAARLQDVQNAVAGGSANLITFTPYGFVSSDNIQGAIQEIVDQTGDATVTTSTGTQTLVEALDSRATVANVALFDTVQEAIDFAVANEIPVYWPDDDFVTSTSLDSFFSVSHVGPGRVVANTRTFTIEPSGGTTNRIYLDPTGSDTNDGLSPENPILTLSKLKAVLASLGDNNLDGNWVAKFSAGTFADATNFPTFPNFVRQFAFIGEGTSRTPQTIFDGDLSAYKTSAFYLQDGINARFEFIKAQNFQTGIGFLAERLCKAEFFDCVAENCNIGYSVGYSSYGRWERCDATDCGTSGFQSTYNSQCTFGPGSSGTLADSCRAFSCGYGFRITRNSVGHIDFCEAEDSVFSAAITEINSRATVVGGDFKRNAIVFRSRVGGWYNFDLSQPFEANEGTADANTRVYEYKGGSGDTSGRGQAGLGSYAIHYNSQNRTVTGTTAETQVGNILYTAPAGWFIEESGMSFKAWGTYDAGPGQISCYLRIAGTATAIAVLGAGTSGSFLMEGQISARDGNTQISYCKITTSNGDSSLGTASEPIDMSAADRVITLAANPTNSGSTVTFQNTELNLIG